MPTNIASTNTVTPGASIAYSFLSDNAAKDSKWGRALNTTMTFGSLAYGAWKFGKTIHEKHVNKSLYRVSIFGNDALYESAMDWLYEEFPPESKKSLLAFSGRLRDHGDDDSPGISSGSRKRTVKYAYNGNMVQTIVVEGHKIDVEVVGHGQGKDTLMSRYNELQFNCQSQSARDVIMEVLGKIIEGESENPPKLFIPRWGGWNRVERQMTRSLESVILPGDQKERMIRNLETFFNSEEIYATLGIPFHHGVLLNGPTGTGKSSFAQALAAHFKMDAYYLPLADLERDTDLNGLISGIPAMSLLLLEDIDSLNSIHDREDSDESAEGGDKMSMSAVLNLLDGALTPYGLTTVATTNRLDVLDSALTRPGRFDIRETLDYVTPGQVGDLFTMTYGRQVYTPTSVKPKVSPADVVEILKNNFHDHPSAISTFEAKHVP